MKLLFFRARVNVLAVDFPHSASSKKIDLARRMLQSRDFMQRAGEILGRAVRRIDKPEAAIAWLESSWATVVGKMLAAHTRPTRCQDGCLEVAADGKAWRKQLESMKADFCARVNQAWGAKLIREIKFVAGKPGPKRAARELDNEHTPFVRRRKG